MAMVLKTIVGQLTVGSNPTPSAIQNSFEAFHYRVQSVKIAPVQPGEVPKWLKGTVC